MLKFFLKLCADKADLEKTDERALRRVIGRLELKEDVTTFKKKFQIVNYNVRLLAREFQIKDWPLWFFSLSDQDQRQIRKRIEGVSDTRVRVFSLMKKEDTFFSFFLPELYHYRRELRGFNAQRRTEAMVVIENLTVRKAFDGQ